MIERMFGGAGPDFGVSLTPQNIAGRDAQVRAQREAVVCGQDRNVLLTSLDRPIAINDCPQIGSLAAHHDPT